MFRTAPVRLRKTGALAKTSYANEIADAFNKSLTLPNTGGSGTEVNGFQFVVAKCAGPLNSRRGWYKFKTFTSRPTPESSDVTGKIKLRESDFGEASDNVNLTGWSPGEVQGGPSIPMDAIVCLQIYGADVDGKPLGIVLQSSGFFPVLVKWSAGTDGSGTTMASYTYDLYDGWDSTFLNKINSLAIQPTRSAARTQFGKVTKASDGSVGSAYIDSTGIIKLWDCQEIRAAAEVCT